MLAEVIAQRKRVTTERMLESKLDTTEETTQITQIFRDRDAAPESGGVVPPGSARLTEAERRALEEAGTMVGAVVGATTVSGADDGDTERISKAPASTRPPKLNMEDYAAILARLERTTNERYVLSEHGLTPSEWHLLQRSWNRLSREDGKVARALRRALAEARLKVK